MNSAAYLVWAAPGRPSECPFTVTAANLPSCSSSWIVWFPSKVRASSLRSSPSKSTRPSTVTVACTGWMARMATMTVGGRTGIEEDVSLPRPSALGAERDRDRSPAAAKTASTRMATPTK